MRRFKTTKRTTYCFAWTEDDEEVTRGKNYYESEALSAESVKTVVLDLLVKREEGYRRSVFFEHSYNVRARNEAIEMKQRRAEMLDKLKEQANVQLMETRTKLLRQAIEQMHYADQIRNLINAVKEKSSNQVVSKELDRWAAWAVEQAEAIDPRAQSLDNTKAWIQNFRLT
jgi:alpha-L-arabinofuranosidase